MAENDRFSWLKWSFGIAAGAVIGAVAVRGFDKFVSKQLKKKEGDEEREIEEAAVAGARAVEPNPFMSPVYAQALSPVIPAMTPTYVMPTMPAMPAMPRAPRMAPIDVGARSVRANDDHEDDEDDEMEEILREYHDLDDD